MHLKRLQLQGFKTFADKTTIEFSEGVTAVVGPNGSGKSNIADAILWVLGEQKASAVRGSSSKDVIFSGSDKRRPLGMAEVSLTVDNSDGKLPVEFAEVTITRRAYRTGEGEYFLNKVPCRLKDIYELFLDTGVGREAYSLVNQSEIDKVLSVNPEDRRGLFEEAAGIKKYKVKKREALRKLDATEGNLQRVRDILGEIEGRIEPLREQAERAIYYNKMRDRLRSIETNLLIIDLRVNDAELIAARRAREAEQLAIATQGTAIDSAQAQLESVSAKLTDAETELEARRARFQESMSDAERAESQRALAAQRASGLAANIHLLAQELESLAVRRERLAGQLAELETELSEAREAEAKLRAQVAERQGATGHLNDQINSLSKQGERRRAEAMNLARQHAARQSDLARAEARVAELEANLPALRDEAQRLTDAAKLRLGEVEAAQIAVAGGKDALAAAEKLFAEAQASRDSARQAAHAAQTDLHASHSRTVAISTRLRTLQDLEDAQEGYFAGVKAVVEAAKHNALKGSFTVVADSFVAPPGYETAFETALAASLQDIITDTEEEAKAAIDYLYQSKLGRATFLPLNRMRPSRDTLDLSRTHGLTGIRGPALDILKFDNKFKPALDVLLGRVFICETLDDALKASKAAQGWSRVVTLTGEIVLPSGAMAGGRQAGRGSGQILGRKTEIATLKSDLKKNDAEELSCRKRLEQAELDREATDKAQNDAQTARQAAQLAASETVRRLEFATAESRRAGEQRDTIVRRAEESQLALANAREQAANAAEALANANIETADIDEALAAESEQVRGLIADRDALQSELTSVRIGLATESEKVINLNRSQKAAQSEIDQIGYQQERKARQSAEAQAEHDSLVTQTTQRDDEGAKAAVARSIALAALETQQLVRQELARDAQIAAQELRRLTDDRNQVLESAHKSELREARLDMQRTQLAARLMEEYEMDVEEALALEEDPEVTDGTPQEVNRLRREIRVMGDVNTGAIEEYEEVSTRYEFLTTQRGDLDEARAKLLDGITDIDASTKGVFIDTFKAVGEAFDILFKRLFRGGITQLVLTNPDDILETGIDIIVQPPGKKRQNLALLSGGERALTAAALLFAFLMVKPSPFCVMDEVDAPLDGANVERFADLLREFGERSQFIIITHNPTTMESAPVWYGITMQEPGISHVLSMKVPVLALEEANKNGNGQQALLIEDAVPA